MDYKLIVESLLYYSPKFRDVLYKMRDEISKDILSIEGEDIKDDLTFIDVDDDGMVTFSTMNNSIGKIRTIVKDSEMDSTWKRESGDTIYDLDSRGSGPNVYNSGRNQLRIGKLVKKLFGNRYNDSEIEKFVNNFKSQITKSQRFEIWEGKKIAKAYDESAYKFRVGSLGQSCMNNKFDWLSIYYNNPDTCKVLVLLEGNEIVARAILWKIDQSWEINNRHDRVRLKKLNIGWFLDRVYSTDDYMVLKMIKWCEKNGYATRYYNNSYDRDILNFNGHKICCELQVKANPPIGESFPYMDTFCRYDIYKKMLFNDAGHIDGNKKPGHILLSLMGQYSSKFYPKTSRIISKFKDFWKSI